MTAHVDDALNRQLVWCCVTAGLAILQVALIASHAPWLDEYQAAMLAVQAPDIATLLEWLRYEGHPPLFYWILRGLAHVVDPQRTLTVVALMCACITQTAILGWSPFSRAERVLLATSEFVLFEFLTVSRSLTLGAMLFVLAVVLWRRRTAWLALALLPMCDFLFGALSVALVVLRRKDKLLWVPGLVLWMIMSILAAWLIRPAPDVVPAIPLTGPLIDSLRYFSNLGTLLLPLQGGLPMRWDMEPWPFGAPLAAVFLWFAWSQTASNHLQRVLLFSFIGLTYALSIAVYPLPIRHLMLIALFLIMLVWLRRQAGERPNGFFKLWLAAAAACGLITAVWNFIQPFDTASRAAAAIKKMSLERKHWMVFLDSQGSGVAVSALTGIEFERPERHCMQSFIRWDYRTTLVTRAKLESYLRSEVLSHGRFYLLSDLKLTGMPSDLLRPLADIPAGFNGQERHIFEVGPSAAENPVQLPPCVSDRRPFVRL